MSVFDAETIRILNTGGWVILIIAAIITVAWLCGAFDSTNNEEGN